MKWTSPIADVRYTEVRKRLSELPGVTFDGQGCVKTTRKLPELIPLTLVPMYVRKLHARYQSGDLPAKETAVYDMRRILRRYRLMPEAGPRICYSAILDPEARHRARLDYLKRWRLKRKKTLGQ